MHALQINQNIDRKERSTRVRNILAFQPYHVNEVDTTVLLPEDKVFVLVQSPKLIESINCDDMSADHIFQVINLMPSLAAHLPFHRLSDTQRQRLTSKHGELCELLAINE